MSESEIEGFLNKVELGLVEAQHDMLVEKALYNRPVVITFTFFHINFKLTVYRQGCGFCLIVLLSEP